jgi:hypothetical protein
VCGYRRFCNVEQKKGRGRHSTLGTTYFWRLLALASSATLLSAMRWVENYHLFALGVSSFASAWLGRSALRQRWPLWARLHIAGMGLSYVLMVVAFYVDNGKTIAVLEGAASFHVLAATSTVRRSAHRLWLLRHPLAQQPSR